MSGCTCTARCKMTASYGRKFVETIARPFVWAMAHFTISSGDLPRNSALALVIRSGLIEKLKGLRSIGRNRLLLQKHAVAPITKALAVVALLCKTRQHRAKFVFDFRILHHVLPNAIQARAGHVATEPDLVPSRRLAHER